VKDGKGQVVAERAASLNPPVVEFKSPLDCAVLRPGDIHTLQWDSRDIDDDPVSFIASYSVDDRENWVPLAYDINDHTVKCDTEGLEKDVDYLVRVTASDMFNTAKDAVLITLSAKESGDIAMQGGWSCTLS
jgi:hypothetical protein